MCGGWYRGLGVPAAVLALAAAIPAAEAGAPNVVVITIDALRADHVGCYGYERPTTPNLDRLITAGVRFTDARTVEPLTGPSMVSMLTSLEPHEHGASRNGLRMRAGLASLPKALQGRGYRTGAFVGNWTLRDKLTGLAEHFESYGEILSRARWFGLIRAEATAEDLTEAAMDWIDDHDGGAHPFFLWVHYVEPHAPYRLHREAAEALGLATSNLPPEDRYDTEIRYVDASVGRLLAHLERSGLDRNTLIVFAADHGESLGEHGYWGHGRNLYEPSLRIPMSITWKGRLVPRTVDAPALIVDLAPTVLSLLDSAHPAAFEGYDWAGVLRGLAPAPMDRITRYQAHRGAVMSRHDSDLARRAGLLDVARIEDGRKEIFHVQRNRAEAYDLGSDPAEANDLTRKDSPPSEALVGWMRDVYDGLVSSDDASPSEPLDPESVQALRSLGYVD